MKNNKENFNKKSKKQRNKKENRIDFIFRLIEVFIVGVVGTLVSVLNCCSSYKANENSEIQLELIKAESKPFFSLQSEIYGENNNEEIVKIYLSHGVAENIAIRHIDFLHIEYSLKNNDDDLDDYIFILDYFNTTFVSGNNDGLIETLRGTDNNIICCQSIIDCQKDTSFDYINIEKQTIFEIMCNDIFGEERCFYYSVTPLCQKSLSLSEGHDMFTIASQSFKKIEMNSLNSESIKIFLGV